MSTIGKSLMIPFGSGYPSTSLSLPSALVLGQNEFSTNSVRGFTTAVRIGPANNDDAM